MSRSMIETAPGTARRVVTGRVAPGFEPVRHAFLENFRRRGELGAACCIYVDGERVVDLWGGVRDPATRAPWEPDTMALVFSATKGMSGLAMALAHSRGLIDHDEPVAAYWPEFAQHGKGRITVRQLLAHQAGLYALDEPTTKELVADLDRLATVLARQRPEWPAGQRQAYHGLTIGFYESELLRRVDPQHRSLGAFFADEIAAPLGIDFYIRLPEEIPDDRLAPLVRPRFDLRSLLSNPPTFVLATLVPWSRIRRALQGTELPQRTDRIYARDLELPAGGGVGSARAIARAYGAFAEDGHELGLRDETLRELMAPAVRPRRGFRDAALKIEAPFSLGFTKPTEKDGFTHPSGFGAPGAGGSLGFADPHDRIGFGYVPNQMVMQLVDPRAMALTEALYRSLGRRWPFRGAG
jgi:CubicO group peptidase (beta-lactamase class C family)